MTQVVVLAGGLASRMAPATERVPKSLLPVAGRPFLAWQLELLARSGASEVVLVVGHLAEPIEAFLAAQPPHGVPVRVVHEGPLRRGTAGALLAARAALAPTFVVTYGDSYLPFDYAAPARALRAVPGALGAMAVWQNHDALEPSNVAFSGGRVVRYDKTRAAGAPALTAIDFGATALHLEALDRVPTDAPAGLDALQSELAAEGRLAACLVNTRFYEIGSPRGLADLERHLRDGGACPPADPPAKAGA